MTATIAEAEGLQTVRCTRDGAVAQIELNRPETLNALNIQLAQDLLRALEIVAADSSIGSLVLTGAGRGFCSGFDLKSGGVPLTDAGRPDTGWGLRQVFNPIVRLLREMPQPVVAAVNGVAAGIGCSYAMACDIVIAARSSFFLLAFVNVGLVPDGGATVLLPARAGLGRALEMALLGERVSAEDACAWGLVNRVVDDENVLAEAAAVAQKLAAGPPQAQADIKHIFNAPHLEALIAALEVEAETQSRRSDSDEAAEAIMAFIAKRAPRYRS